LRSLEATVRSVDELRVLFRSAFGLEAAADVDHLEYRGIEAWDSLAHMNLVADIEDYFGVFFEPDDVIDLSSFEQAHKILGTHGVELG
jgi:acyl carrier protein